MKIIIPTYRRPNRQITLKHIPEELLSKTYLVVRHEEAELYMKYLKMGVNIYRVSNVNNLSDTMQAVADNFTGNILKLDDDLNFQEIDRAESKMKTFSSSQQFKKFYNWAKDRLENGYAHVAIPERLEAMRINLNQGGYPAGLEIKNQRYFGLAGYNLDVLKKHNIRFDDVILRQDYHVNLSLLKRGYASLVHTRWCFTQTSNAKGGCSSYRTVQLNNEEAVKFVRLHPCCSQLVKKIKKTAGLKKPHLQVKVFPKKAYRGH